MSSPFVLARTIPSIPESAVWLALTVVAVAVVFFSFVMMLVKRYKRCPSNRILVIYGKVGGGNTSKCVHGGAAFVLPLIQDHAYLSLEPIQIEVPLKGALSIENIRVNVPSVFTVAIGTEPRGDAKRRHPPAGPEHPRRSSSRPSTSSSASCGR